MHSNTKWDQAKSRLSPARIHPEALRGAASDVADLLAFEMHPGCEDVGLPEQIQALREPIMAAAVLSDLFSLLDVGPPAIVNEALQ